MCFVHYKNYDPAEIRIPYLVLISYDVNKPDR